MLLTYEEPDVREVPGIGTALQDYIKNYHAFRQRALAAEERLISRIGKIVSVRFRVGWQIYLNYVIMRFAGASNEEIISWGDFLNYDITWEDAERVFARLNDDSNLASEMSGLLQAHQRLCDTLGGFLQTNAASEGTV